MIVLQYEREDDMAVRLFGYEAFGPEDVRAMIIAFESALLRTDRPPELVARKIIEFAMTGERDSRNLCEVVLRSLHNVTASEDAAA
jgi:hypothetical protein